MPTSLLITIIVCVTLVTISAIQTKHKERMAELQLKRDSNPFIQIKGGKKNE